MNAARDTETAVVVAGKLARAAVALTPSAVDRRARAERSNRTPGQARVTRNAQHSKQVTPFTAMRCSGSLLGLRPVLGSCFRGGQLLRRAETRRQGSGCAWHHLVVLDI